MSVEKIPRIYCWHFIDANNSYPVAYQKAKSFAFKP